jgi:hypothetical protein
MVISKQKFLRGIIGQVKEESDTFHAAVLFKVTSEEPTSFHINTHSGEDDGEILFVAIVDVLGWLHETSLPTDLSSDFVMRETSG